MASFHSTSRLYQEEVERHIETMVVGDSWHQSLIRFARSGPHTGSPESNREIVREQHRLSPLMALMPTQLLTPEGLPLYSGTSEADRFQLDLVRWEVQLLQQLVPPVVRALHEIPRRHGLPPLEQISGSLATWPAATDETADALARGILRFWAGDYEGAAFTVIPRIESLLRTLVLRRGRAIYRLQQEQTPGQYAGLGRLIPIVAEEYDVEEGWTRYLNAFLREPGGWNVRNLALHGYIGDPGAGIAALAIHCALFVLTIEPPAEPDVEPAEGSTHAAEVDEERAG